MLLSKKAKTPAHQLIHSQIDKRISNHVKKDSHLIENRPKNCEKKEMRTTNPIAMWEWQSEKIKQLVKGTKNRTAEKNMKRKTFFKIQSNYPPQSAWGEGQVAGKSNRTYVSKIQIN